jgi:hypothetical protein
VQEEIPAKLRIVTRFTVPEDEVALLAARLGYTLGIVRVTPHPVTGRGGSFAMRGRWPSGWMRQGDNDVLFEEVFASDEEARLAASPHRAEFPLIDADGKVSRLAGRRLNRRLSPLDARFCANVCGIRDGSTVLDPFAGLCVLADAMMARGLRVSVSDADPGLRIGFPEHSPGRALIGDARWLPFADATFDGIVTEPPYHPDDQCAVLAGIPELRRIVRPGGRIGLLVGDFMVEAVSTAATGAGLVECTRHHVRRHGLQSVYLVHERP